MANEFTIQGLDEVLKKMRAMGPALSGKGAKTAMRKAANIVRDAAKSNAASLDDPISSNRIADNVAIQFASRTFKRTGDVMFRVGIRGGARSTSREALKSAARRRRQGIASLAELGEFAGKGAGNPGGDTFYWRFLEFGTSKMGARPFMRPALEQNVDKATNVAVTELNKALDRLAKKAGG